MRACLIALAITSSGCAFGAGFHAGPALVGNDPQWSGGGDFEATADVGVSPNDSYSTLTLQGRAHGGVFERYGVLSLGLGLSYSHRTDFGSLFIIAGLDGPDLHITPTGEWGGAFGPFGRLGVGFTLARTGLDDPRADRRYALVHSGFVETTLLTASIGAEYDVLFETTHVAIFTARIGIVFWADTRTYGGMRM